MIHPNIPAELPGINLERDLLTLSRVTIRRKPSVTEQAAAASISAGLDARHEDNAMTRGVHDAPATNGGDNTDEGVTDEGVGLDEAGDDDIPRLTTEDDDSDSHEDNSDSDEDNANVEDGTPANTLNEDSVDNETSTVQRKSVRSLCTTLFRSMAGLL